LSLSERPARAKTLEREALPVLRPLTAQIQPMQDAPSTLLRS